MKKKMYFVLVIAGLLVLMGSCRGLKSAPPCPAYSMVEIPASNVQIN